MADPKDEITTQDILAQYGPTPQAKPKDEHGFLFSNVGGELKFNPWESIKNFMSYRAPPGALSTSGDSKPVEHAFEAAVWPALPGLGLNVYGAMAPGGLRAAQSVLTSAGARVPKVAPAVERELDPLGFYSAALEGAKTWPMERGSPSQALAHLKKSGTKDAEITATGLDKYLAEQDVVTRQAMEDYLRENRVQVQEQKYGPLSYEVRRSGDDVLMDGPFTDPLDARSSMRSYAGYGDRYYITETPPEGMKGAKWQEYALDTSNPSYRESVMHLSPENRDNLAMRMFGARFDSLPEDQMRKVLEKYRDNRGNDFRSGHWDEPNVVAHMRTSIQPDEAGRPAFLIDELQSDWGQKLREGGVRDEAKVSQLRQRQQNLLQQAMELKQPVMDELGGRWYDNDRIENWLKAQADSVWADESQPLTIKMKKWAKDWDLTNAELKTAEASTPGHPLVNTTDQWTTTGIRRLLQQAAEADAAGIALTPGQLQNERFDLAKQVGEMSLSNIGHQGRNAALLPEGELALRAWDPDGRTIYDGANTYWPVKTVEDLAKIIGKEHAERMWSLPREASHGDVTIPGAVGAFYSPGDNAEIGGSGMRYAYDQMYPKKIAKELKRLDPEHPGVTQRRLQATDNMEVPKRREIGKEPVIDMPFNYFELTPRAKEEIRKGLPLFSMPGIPVADLLRAYYGGEKE